MSNFKKYLMSVIQQHNNAVEWTKAEIPSTIHRIWVGGAMPEETFKTLSHFQEHIREKGGQYTHFLWTYSVTDPTLQDQITKLEHIGMQIRDMAEVLGSNPEIERAVTEKLKRAEQEASNYKYVSDIFRMYILYIEGGIYMDADIGVRNELFDEPVFHRFQFKDGGYMPLLGSVAPFADLFVQAGRAVDAYIDLEFAQYMKKAYVWNYFFASIPGNPVIEQMLQEVCSGNGQTMTINLIDRFLAEIPGEEDEKRGALFDYAFAPLDLQYFTTASINK